MSDAVFGRRRVETIGRDDLHRRLTTAQVAAQIAAAADQLQAAFRAIEPKLDELNDPPPTPKEDR